MARSIPVHEMQGVAHQVLVSLPSALYTSIGSVVQAHAQLEHICQLLLFDLCQTPYPQGRVAFAFRDPAVLFGISRKLLDLHGIQIGGINLENLESEIRARTAERNKLAHGVWVPATDGQCAILVSEGQYPTADGRVHNRKFLPQPFIPSEEYFSDTRKDTLETTRKIVSLRGFVQQSLTENSK